jgi:hypothetical protein
MRLRSHGEPLELTFQRLGGLLKRHLQTFSTLGRTKEQRWVSLHVLVR